MSSERVSHPGGGRAGTGRRGARGGRRSLCLPARLGEDLPDKRVGEEFVRIGVLTESQVEAVLEKQKQDPKFFGEIAVEMGFVNNEKLGMYLAAAKHGHERGNA